MSSRTFSGVTASILAVSLLAAGCGGGGADDSEDLGFSAPAAQVIDPATVATITGTINLDGEAPEAVLIRMNADPVCLREGTGQKTESLVPGDNGTLQNVLVYVKDGLSGSFPAPTTPVVLDQVGCNYTPHVFGIMVGQPLEVVNSDSTLHNIHAIPATNQEFNTGQPIKGMRFNHTFSAKEVMVPFKCDVHGWMNAFAAVLDHPFFAVSSTDGTFEITGLPPGTYVIEAWHEELGSQTTEVTVAAQESMAADFTFNLPS
jgi:plastocyanin